MTPLKVVKMEKNNSKEFYPVAENENERLAELRQLGIMHSLPETHFDAVCRLATQIFDVPIALVTLVDEDQQWFKAKCGLDIDSTSRDVSFCNYTILTDDVFVVPDAASDQRFRENPLVVADPSIRFYAGVPLIIREGVRLGAFCIIDRVPRVLSPEQIAQLRDLANIVTAGLFLTKARGEAVAENQHRRDNEELLQEKNATLCRMQERIQDWVRMSSDWAFETDANYRITSVIGSTDTANENLDHWEGLYLCEALAGDGAGNACATELAFAFSDFQSLNGFKAELHPESGTHLVIEINAKPVFDLGGTFNGYRGTVRDITQREEELRRLWQAETIAQQTQYGIIITDREGVIEWVNPGFVEITGYEFHEVIGLRPGSFLQFEETDAQTVREISQALKNGEGIRRTILNRNKNGTPWWADIDIRPIVAEHGEVSGFAALQSDITAFVEEKSRKEAFFENATAGIVIHDESGQPIECNEEALRILGLTRDQLIGAGPKSRNWTLVDCHGNILKPEYKPAVRVLLNDEIIRDEIVGIREDNKDLRWIRVSAKTFYSGTRKKRYSLFSFVDITDEENQSRSLRATQELLNSIIDTMPDALFVYDANDKFYFANSMYRELFPHVEEAQRLGMSFEDTVRMGIERQVYQNIGSDENEAGRWLQMRIENHRRGDATPISVALDSGKWVQIREQRAASGATIGVATDITSLKNAEEKIRIVSEQDGLTGLVNRNTFLRDFNQSLHGKRRDDGYGVVALIDLDHFKDLNDTLGHDVGDAFLKEISRRLLEATRSSDVVARLGGDEFALLFPGVTCRNVASQILQGIIDKAAAPFDLAGKIVHARMSVGVSMYPEDGNNATELLKNADIAMYVAKKSGRNGIAFFEPSQREEISRRTFISERLRAAIRDEMLDVALQAQFEVNTGRHVGFEALARWRLFGEQISPAEFIPIAEEFGCALELDLQILNKSLLVIKRLKDAGYYPGILAVNLGALSLRDETLSLRVANLLADTGLLPSELEIEVTESVILGRHNERVKRNLNAFRDLGTRIALDDFGTGYASLTHLKNFKVDKIKIDKGFVSGLTSDKGDEVIVRTIINLGQAFDIQITAEGIETIQQNEMLAEFGCHTGQGYLFHRPETNIDSIIKYLEACHTTNKLIYMKK